MKNQEEKRKEQKDITAKHEAFKAVLDALKPLSEDDRESVWKATAAFYGICQR